MPIVTPSEGLDLIMVDAERIVTQEALGLNADLISATPVDTGHMKTSWHVVKKSGESGLAWTIYNPVEYASIIAAGRRVVNGKAYGSEQLVNGFDPLIKQTDISISRRMQGIKR